MPNNSPRCPANPEHGLLVELKNDQLYCPHHDHDNLIDGKRIKPFFSPNNLTSDPIPTREIIRPRAEELKDTGASRVARDTEETIKTCTKCGGTYLPGEYGTHKLLDSHLKTLGVQK